MSMIEPLIDPIWAAARGANAQLSPTTRIAASAPDLLKSFMLHSPFHRGSLSGFSGPHAPHYPSAPRQIPISTPRGSRLPVGYGVCRSCFGKRAQPQKATVANAAGHLFLLITRPRQVQWRPQLQTTADDFALLHLDDRCHDLNLCFRSRSHTDQFLKHAVIFRPAVRITGAVFRHRAYINRSRAD